MIHLGQNLLGEAGRQSLSRALALTVCVIVDGLDDRALAANQSLASTRQKVVKPNIRSLVALMDDPRDLSLAEIIQLILKRTTRAAAAQV